VTKRVVSIVPVLIMKAVAGEPRHGYGVADAIRRITDGTLEIEDGALYTSLHRMEKRGWLEAEWGVSDSNRRAKFYALTAAGRKALDDATGEWSRYAEAVFKVLGSESGGAR
jgi:transcriptional regulator